MIVKTDAITLNARKYGDSSKIVAFFTRDYGKVSLMAKGVRSAKNKYGSALEPLSYVELFFYQKHNNELHLLSEVNINKQFRRLQSNYDAITSGLIIAELTNITQENDHPNSELFDYLLSSIELLNNTEKNYFSIVVAYMFKLAESLGFFLDFNFMNVDESNPNQLYPFSLEHGCAAIAGEHSKVFRMSRNVLKILKEIYDCEQKDSANIAIDIRSQNEIHDFFVSYLGFHLEKKINLKSYNLLNI